MIDPNAIKPLGPGEPSALTGQEQRAYRAFLSLQESVLKAGLIDAIAGSVERLKEMATDLRASRRTRQRAEALLQALARHVIPAPARVAIDARQVNVTVGIDRGAYQRLLGNAATREAALSLLDAAAGVPTVPQVIDVVPSPPPTTNGHAVNGEARS